ncbi:PBECR4 domain-containing protein, partial [Waltera sp.]
MYKAEELCGLLIKPKINDIDLDVLQDYYRKFLNPFIYQYDITENEKQSSIQLRFDEENFCHLLGIESIVKYSVSKKEIHHYKGQGGWDYIQNTGLCFNDLKRMNKSKFKSIKAKFVYFYLMPDILENPVAVNFKN